MTPLRLPDFMNVVAGNTATLKIPHYKQTLIGIGLRLGGTTFTKAHIDSIVLKLGTRPVWSCYGGADLDKINKYKGLFDQATNLSIWFKERDFKNIIASEIGGYDMSVLDDDLYLEVKISGTAVAPTLFANAFFTPPQTKETDPNQLVQKLVHLNVPITFGGAGNKAGVNWDPKGALVKRAYIMYGGADWAAGVNGNITKVDVRKNGNSVHELECIDARFLQQEHRFVPQTKMYVVDFTVDNHLEGALPTGDAQALEWNTYPGAADVAKIYYEVLDRPFNL